MITIMDGLDRGKICKKYLEELVDIDKSKIVIWDHKNLVNIEDIESFHQIAQGSEIKKIRQYGGLSYTIDIPNEGNSFSKHWMIALEDYLTQDFMSKYGKNYEIME